MSLTAATPRRRLQRAGVAILIAGWVAAAFVFFMAGSGDATATADRRIVNGQVYDVPLDSSKRDLQQVERMGGKATVRMVELEAWLGSLWHGKRLACMLALLAAAAGGACLYLAGLAAEPDVEEGVEEGRRRH
jgi:hypothetical protein